MIKSKKSLLYTAKEKLMTEENNEEDEKITNAEDDFEKLLQSFINSKIDEDDDVLESAPTEKAKTEKDTPKLSEEGKRQNDEISKLFEQELANTFAEARNAIEEEKNTPTLGSEESELAQAFMNYQSSVDKLSKQFLQEEFLHF